jgi:hypothetical protein
MLPPEDHKQLQSVLGLCSYYRCFYPNLSKDMEPLNMLMKKNVKFEWGEGQQAAFEKIRSGLVEKFNSFIFPDFSLPFILRTDACETGIGGVLLQDAEKSQLLPVVHVSHSLTVSERKWSIIEKEAFAIVWCILRLSAYLLGRHFLVQTDHKNLKWMDKSKNRRVQRWSLALEDYDFDIEYIPGPKNSVADALSCVPKTLDEAGDDGSPDLSGQLLTQAHFLRSSVRKSAPVEPTPPEEPLEIAESEPLLPLLGDKYLEELHAAQQEMPDHDSKYLASHGQFVEIDGDGSPKLWHVQDKLFIPSNADDLKANVTSLAHDHFLSGHCGVISTMHRIRSGGFTFPEMRKIG